MIKQQLIKDFEKKEYEKDGWSVVKESNLDKSKYSEFLNRQLVNGYKKKVGGLIIVEKKVEKKVKK